MPLQKGARLGPYEIVSALGAGGMGEVYRGRDTRLDRSVAVKVLPPHLAGAAEVRQRFEVEARAISALQHPHVCALHDVGSQDGVDFLVMELLEGETLAARLERGPLPLAEALRVAAEIADALAAAHRHGIVHRDLKPGNVMLTRSGVKLVDFGLARRHAGPTASPALSQERTRAAPLTAEGTILGTLHYMAPEQLEGRPVDARADVFALGAVVYEMVTGTRAFDGASAASVISAVLREEPPPVSSRASLAPPALDALVRLCLAKDPTERWESAHDLRLQLQAIAAAPGGAGASRGDVAAGRRRLPWLAAALAAATAVGLGLALLADRVSRPAPPEPVRFELPPPPGVGFRDWVEAVSMAFAPDGSALAFIVAGPAYDEVAVWIRPLGELTARKVPGTEGATSLFWSPDSESIAFFGQGKLRRVPRSGGTPVAICDVPTWIGLAGTWGSRDTILFASVQGDAIYRVAAGGGTPEVAVAAFDDASTVGRAAWPWYLPDGERFLFLASRGAAFELRLAEADGTSRTVAPGASRTELLDDGWVVFARDGGLVAQRLDADRAALVGPPVAIAPVVRSFGSTGWASFATSRRGAVALGAQDEAARLTWFDADGRPAGVLGPPANSVSVAIAPDGRRALTDRLHPDRATYDLWTIDLVRGVESRLTSAPGTEVFGRWLPGGRSIVYSASHGDSPRLVRRDLASGRDEPLLPTGPFQVATAVTPDGRELLFRQRRASGGYDLWSLPLAGGEPTPVLPEGTVVSTAAISPDGQLLAYVSADSGRFEAYLRPLAGGEAVRVSLDGARDLAFSPDGRQLYVSAPDRRLLAAAVTTRPHLEVGAPELRFPLAGLGWLDFDVHPDGRFLALVPEVDVAKAPRTVITGWRE